MGEIALNFKITKRVGYRMAGRFKDGGHGYIEDSDNKAGHKRVRRISFLERWRDTHVITKAEFAAAQHFEEDYCFAHRPPNYACNSLYRVDGGNGAKEMPERVLLRQKQAMQRVREALGAVGPRGAFIVTRCVGDGLSINSVVKGSDRGMAKGLLIGALSRLSGHYGLE